MSKAKLQRLALYGLFVFFVYFWTRGLHQCGIYAAFMVGFFASRRLPNSDFKQWDQLD
jgi:hypothetical protein